MEQYSTKRWEVIEHTHILQFSLERRDLPIEWYTRRTHFWKTNAPVAPPISSWGRCCITEFDDKLTEATRLPTTEGTGYLTGVNIEWIIISSKAADKCCNFHVTNHAHGSLPTNHYSSSLTCVNRSEIIHKEIRAGNREIEKPCCLMAVDAGRPSAAETSSYTHFSPWRLGAEWVGGKAPVPTPFCS